MLCVMGVTSQYKQSNPSQQQTIVYVCTGSYASKYHRVANCRGLGNCKGQIVKMHRDKAAAQGRKACKLCYR